MHLGVVNTEYEQWCKLFLNKDKKKGIQIIETRLSKITPIREVHKKPTSLSRRNEIKAKDFKNWLLVYSTPVCLDLLPLDIMEQHALLVNLNYTLSKSSMYFDEIDESEIELLKYVVKFEQQFGQESIRSNIHIT